MDSAILDNSLNNYLANYPFDQKADLIKKLALIGIKSLQDESEKIVPLQLINKLSNKIILQSGKSQCFFGEIQQIKSQLNVLSHKLENFGINENLNIAKRLKTEEDNKKKKPIFQKIQTQKQQKVQKNDQIIKKSTNINTKQPNYLKNVQSKIKECIKIDKEAKKNSQKTPYFTSNNNSKIPEIPLQIIKDDKQLIFQQKMNKLQQEGINKVPLLSRKSGRLFPQYIQNEQVIYTERLNIEKQDNSSSNSSIFSKFDPNQDPRGVFQFKDSNEEYFYGQNDNKNINFQKVFSQYLDTYNESNKENYIQS